MPEGLITSGSSLLDAPILVVDDLPANLELLVGMLEMAGFSDIRATTNPHQGLEECRTRVPDLVLLDFRMPGLDGPGFLKALLDEQGDLAPPVIMVTAQNDEGSRRQALEAGARDYITKPYAMWELLARVRNMLTLQGLLKAQRSESARLERQVGERTEELERTRSEIIRRLCSAGEFRDNETGQHVARIGRISAVLAEVAGLNPAFCVKLGKAAPLHDIGKIGIPDRVLLKPGPLDAQERAEIEKHCALGHGILAGSGLTLLDMAAEIALTHHEKFDGTGYPQRLSGTDIPLSGRIVAIVDVYDALLSKRPYKEPWPMERVLNHLQDGSGRHFDPDLLRLFLDNAETMTAIRAEMAD